MSILKIRKFPDQILRRVSFPVKRVNREIEILIQNLIETMYAQRGGIGIAAPQVGVLKRIAIVDVSAKVPSAERLVLINPTVKEAEMRRTMREGCMSLPDYTANVERWDRIVVIWQRPDGGLRRKTSTGIEAVCIQHEIDHLNGMLFVDRVGSLKSDVFRRKKYL